MSKIRIYFESKIEKDLKLEISKSQYHYLVNVMRKKAGENIVLFNEKDGEWLAEVSFFGKSLKVYPKKKLKESLDCVFDIWICFGIIKPRNINFLIEKVSEIGVNKLIPMKTEFSENIKLNYQRLNKIAIEAIEQSGGIRIPTILETIDIKNLLADWDKERAIILCDERGKSKNLAKTLLEFPFKKKFAIFLGPVGGWSENDLSEFKKIKEVFFVSLGERLLKADTAAIFALSCCNAIFLNKNDK